jgi:hypothetical protein
MSQARRGARHYISELQAQALDQSNCAHVQSAVQGRACSAHLHNLALCIVHLPAANAVAQHGGWVPHQGQLHDRYVYITLSAAGQGLGQQFQGAEQ